MTLPCLLLLLLLHCGTAQFAVKLESVACKWSCLPYVHNFSCGTDRQIIIVKAEYGYLDFPMVNFCPCTESSCSVGRAPYVGTVTRTASGCLMASNCCNKDEVGCRQDYGQAELEHAFEACWGRGACLLPGGEGQGVRCTSRARDTTKLSFSFLRYLCVAHNTIRGLDFSSKSSVDAPVVFASYNANYSSIFSRNLNGAKSLTMSWSCTASVQPGSDVINMVVVNVPSSSNVTSDMDASVRLDDVLKIDGVRVKHWHKVQIFNDMGSSVRFHLSLSRRMYVNDIKVWIMGSTTSSHVNLTCGFVLLGSAGPKATDDHPHDEKNSPAEGPTLEKSAFPMEIVWYSVAVFISILVIVLIVVLVALTRRSNRLKGDDSTGPIVQESESSVSFSHHTPDSPAMCHVNPAPPSYEVVMHDGTEFHSTMTTRDDTPYDTLGQSRKPNPDSPSLYGHLVFENSRRNSATSDPTYDRVTLTPGRRDVIDNVYEVARGNNRTGVVGNNYEVAKLPR